MRTWNISNRVLVDLEKLSAEYGWPISDIVVTALDVHISRHSHKWPKFQFKESVEKTILKSWRIPEQLIYELDVAAAHFHVSTGEYVSRVLESDLLG